MIYVTKFLILFLLSYPTIAADYFSEIRFENQAGRNSFSDSETYLIFDTYIYAMKISWPVVFICIILIAPILQRFTHKLTS